MWSKYCLLRARYRRCSSGGIGGARGVRKANRPVIRYDLPNGGFVPIGHVPRGNPSGLAR